ncbi:flagellar protein FliT [Virgibacillus profundi]|uniref:Flagellar protein FliT n=1 Tax=Virgibacillus profundi TaxID=2024555 RepID=A0A2A2IHL5_9BACI|nr:flagellar protein FliT [Virgibacillus profundi]PAV31022.1 flagellar protein FliT [Virgibacillus profundi]PXY55207.1 flagellar protein FliT [Virgibacillus profundi]
MNRLQVLYDVSLQLNKVLDQDITEKNRETVIEQINELIDKRGIHLETITSPYTENEKQLGKKIVQLNNEIQEKMQQLFDELKSEMKQVKKQKKSNRTYSNPYENIQAMDGMFLDSKK